MQRRTIWDRFESLGSWDPDKISRAEANDLYMYITEVKKEEEKRDEALQKLERENVWWRQQFHDLWAAVERARDEADEKRLALECQVEDLKAQIEQSSTMQEAEARAREESAARIQALEESVKQLRDRAARYKAERSALREELGGLKKAHDVQVEALSTDLDAREAEVRSLKEALDGERSRAAKLEVDLRGERVALLELVAQEADLRHERDGALADVARLTAELQTASDGYEHVRARLAALEEDYGAKCDQNGSLSRSNFELTERITALHEQIAALQAEREKLQADAAAIPEVSAKLDELRAQLSTTDAARQALESEREQMQSTNAQLLLVQQELEGRLIDAAAAQEVLKLQLDETEAAVHRALEEKSAAEARAAEVKAERDDARVELHTFQAQREEERERLVKQLQEISGEMEAEIVKGEEAARQLHMLQSAHAKLQEAHGAVMAQLQQQQDQISMLQLNHEALEDSRRRTAAVERQLHETQAQLETARQELETARQELKETKGELDFALEEQERARGMLTEEEELRKAQADLDASQRRVQEERAALEALRSELEAAQEELQRQRKKLRDEIRTHEALHLAASLPIPTDRSPAAKGTPRSPHKPAAVLEEKGAAAAEEGHVDGTAGREAEDLTGLPEVPASFLAEGLATAHQQQEEQGMGTEMQEEAPAALPETKQRKSRKRKAAEISAAPEEGAVEDGAGPSTAPVETTPLSAKKRARTTPAKAAASPVAAPTATAVKKSGGWGLFGLVRGILGLGRGQPEEEQTGPASLPAAQPEAEAEGPNAGSGGAKSEDDAGGKTATPVPRQVSGRMPKTDLKALGRTARAEEEEEAGGFRSEGPGLKRGRRAVARTAVEREEGAPKEAEEEAGPSTLQATTTTLGIAEDTAAAPAPEAGKRKRGRPSKKPKAATTGAPEGVSNVTPAKSAQKKVRSGASGNDTPARTAATVFSPSGPVTRSALKGSQATPKD